MNVYVNRECLKNHNNYDEAEVKSENADIKELQVNLTENIMKNLTDMINRDIDSKVFGLKKALNDNIRNFTQRTESEITDVKENVAVLKRRLTEDITNLTERTQTDITEVAKNASNNLLRSTSMLRGMMFASGNQIEEIQSKIAKSESQIQNIQAEVSKYHDDFVAFSLYGTFGEFTSKGVVPFRGIHLNRGNGFSTSTSKFTCPRSGIYLFTYSIYSWGLKYGTSYYQSGAQLMMDGYIMNTAYASTYDSTGSHYHQSSNSAILMCTRGRQVWLKVPYSYNRIFSESSNKHTTFSGVLLHPV